LYIHNIANEIEILVLNLLKNVGSVLELGNQGWQFPGGKYWEIRIWIPGNKNLDDFGGKYGYIYHTISITRCTDCSIMCAG